MSLLEPFCHVDDFCQAFGPQWQQSLSQHGAIQRVRQAQLSTSVMMTTVIRFHQTRYRNFKAYYTEYALVHLQDEFLQLVGYSRFVKLMGRMVVPLIAYERTCPAWEEEGEQITTRFMNPFLYL
jgi:hypothetical protein